MKHRRLLRTCVGLVTLTLGCLTITEESSGVPSSATRHWTADNGNGTYSNSLFYEEFDDSDIIRVGDDYYLAGTAIKSPAGRLFSRMTPG